MVKEKSGSICLIEINVPKGLVGIRSVSGKNLRDGCLCSIESNVLKVWSGRDGFPAGTFRTVKVFTGMGEYVKL